MIPNLSVISGNKYIFTWILILNSQLSFIQKQMIRQNTSINFWSFIFKSEGIDFKSISPDGFLWLSLFITTHSIQSYAFHYLWPPKALYFILGLRFFMNQKLHTHQIIIKNWQMPLFTKWLHLRLSVNRTSVTLKNIWLSRPIAIRTLPQTIKLETWCDWISEIFTMADILLINWTWKLMNFSESFKKLISMYTS